MPPWIATYEQPESASGERTVAVVAEVRSKLRDGSSVVANNIGLRAPWFVGENEFQDVCVRWDQIKRVRRLRLGNPFQALKKGFEHYETGFFIEDETARTFAFEADEKGYEEVMASIRARLETRWRDVYDDNEVVAIHDGMDLHAPSTLRRPYEVIRDPLLAVRGALRAMEPTKVREGRARPLLRRALIHLAVGWLLSSFGAVLVAFGHPFGIAIQVIVGAPLIAVGLFFLVSSSLSFFRWKWIKPLVVYETGLLVPAQFWGVREQFIPFSLVRLIESGYRRGIGEVLVVHLLPWVRSVEIPATFPQIREFLEPESVVSE